MKNDLKRKLQNGEKTAGAWITIPHPDISETLSTFPFDWFLFGQEHPPLNDQLAQQLIQSMWGNGVTPLIRLAWNDPAVINDTWRFCL